MPLPSERQQELCQVINDKVMASAVANTEVGPVALKQDMPHPELFLTKEDWDAVVGPSCDLDTRVRTLANRFMLMDHFYPTEHAVNNIVALALHGQGAPSPRRNQGIELQQDV